MAVERSQKIEDLSTEFRAKVRQNTPKSQISNPHISPKWGPIPPSKKKFSQGHQHYKRHKSDWGCGPRKGVNPKRAPPPNFGRHFLENPSSDFSQKLIQGKRLSDVCKFVLWSRSDDRISRKTSHSFWGFSGLGAKPQMPAGH